MIQKTIHGKDGFVKAIQTWNRLPKGFNQPKTEYHGTLYSTDHVIAIPIYNRPRYFLQTLDALSKCNGIEKYLIVVSAEPLCREVIDMALNIKFASRFVVVNAEKIGCSANVYNALSTGFKASDYVICVEDDVLLAPDTLQYFEWCKDRFRNDPEIYTIGCYIRNPGPCVESNMYVCKRCPWFIAWGWATWRNRWEEPGGMRDDWDFNYQHEGWDININHRLRRDRQEIYPVLSRSQNIGTVGVHVPSPEWHAQHQHSEYWAGHPEMKRRLQGLPVQGTIWTLQ
jgi:hypothetical protein